MKLMVIGGGGREHAIIKKLKEIPRLEKIYCLPGNGASPPTQSASVRSAAKDTPRRSNLPRRTALIMPLSRPDDPLALGAVDALSAAGIPCFGPDKKAAVIEASKAFAKDLMQKYNIPTAKYRVFTDAPLRLCLHRRRGCAHRRQGDGSCARQGRRRRADSRGGEGRRARDDRG